jgi:hypothetical protein
MRSSWLLSVKALRQKRPKQPEESEKWGMKMNRETWKNEFKRHGQQ